jgi:hypothetical protein
MSIGISLFAKIAALVAGGTTCEIKRYKKENSRVNTTLAALSIFLT